MRLLSWSRGPRSLSAAWQALAGAWLRWRERLLAFMAGQLSVQLLAAVTGFLVLRWLTEDEYAKVGVVLSFQATLTVLTDLGLGGALVSLVGARGHQREVVGAYAAATHWWRRLLMLVVTPVGAAAFFFITTRQGWSPSESVGLFACMAVTLYFAGITAWASAPLLIHQRLTAFYKISNAGAVVRLGGCVALHLAGRLDALTLTVLGALVSAGTAWMYRRAAVDLMAYPMRDTAEVRSEVRKYVSPLVPTVVFFAVQGQLGTFLIASLGQSQGIAEVSALGRLALLFTFLTAAYAMLVVPYFARLPRARLAPRYVGAVIATLAIAALVSAVSFMFPAPLLWLLGPRYGHLDHEMGWLMLAGSLSFAAGAIGLIHTARKWVFWWGTAGYLAAVIATQVVFISLFDMGTTINVLYLGVAGGVASLIAQGLVTWLGFRYETAQSRSSDNIAAAVAADGVCR